MTRWFRWLIGACLVIAAGAAAASWGFREPPPPPVVAPIPDEVERYRSDPALLAKLGHRPMKSESPEPPPGGWPQWRGPRRDGISREPITLAPWGSEGPTRLWSAAGGEGHSSLAVADGRVYTMVQQGAEEAVLCLDAAAGTELWRHRYPGRFLESFAGVGPHSTPAVADGRIYTLGAQGRFLCLDAKTGKPLWEHDLLAEFQTPNPEYGMSCSPLIDGNKVIVLPGSARRGTVAAFDRTDGRLLWTSLRDRSGYSSPVVATVGGRRQLVVVTGESVAGLVPDTGEVLWRKEWTVHRECNVADPIVSGDLVFVSSGYGKGCALFQIGDRSAQAIYEHNRMRNHFTTGILHGDHYYGFDEGLLACMEFRSGKIVWKQRTSGKGNLLLAGDTLIVLEETGKMSLLDPTPEAFHERASFTVTRSRCWATPTLCGGKLYLRDQASIFCFDLEHGR